jgi:ankyrin repeat protein
VWAAKSDRVDALEPLVELGADVDGDPYRGTALIWAGAVGRVASIRRLIELGADPSLKATFGGPDHGRGVTALHIAAQSGKRAAVEALLAAGADPAITDDIYDSLPAGWAEHGGHPAIASILRAHGG